jgi:hypothetical protein
VAISRAVFSIGDFTIHCSRFAVRSATRVSEVRHLA